MCLHVGRCCFGLGRGLPGVMRHWEQTGRGTQHSELILQPQRTGCWARWASWTDVQKTCMTLCAPIAPIRLTHC